MTTEETTALIAAIISGAPYDADAVGRLGPTGLLAAAAEHDVVPLMADRLLADHRSRPAGTLGGPLAATLRDQARAAAVVDLRREAEIRRIVAAAAVAGVPLLLIKGSALAYTHYPRSDLRSRVDTDLLTARHMMAAVHDLVAHDLGYALVQRVSDDLTNPQRIYRRQLVQGISHAIDVHWELASPRVFASMPGFDELLAEAVSIPALGPSARAPSAAHAMLIACVHRVAHHLDAPDLKWVYDIHLLAARFNHGDWRRVASEARLRQVAEVCRHGLTLARATFGTPVPTELLTGSELAVHGQAEPSAAYLVRASKVERLLHDARQLTWRRRLQLAGAHLFPGNGYMRNTYAPSSRLPLGVLYLLRAVRGAGGWFRRGR